MHTKKVSTSQLMTGSTLALALLLVGCGSSEETQAPEEQAEEPAEQSTGAEEAPEEEAEEEAGEESEEPASDEAEGPAGEATEVSMDVTFSDPDMGDDISILSAVRNFQSEENADVYEDGGEIVLIEVEVTPGQEYGGAISVGAFAISWDDGADFWNNDTRHVEDDMAAAGYPALEDVRRMEGETGTGWVAFFAGDAANTYIIEYERRAASVIGSDEELDAFVETFEVPSS